MLPNFLFVNLSSFFFFLVTNSLWQIHCWKEIRASVALGLSDVRLVAKNLRSFSLVPAKAIRVIS